MEGGPVVEVGEGNSHPRDSTILEADHGAPTMEDALRLRRREIEEGAKEAKGGGEEAGSPGSGGDPANAQDPAHPSPSPSSPQSPEPGEEKTKERGDAARTRRSRDGAWTKKRDISFFGYKLHTKVSAWTGFIEDYEVTPSPGERARQPG